MPFGSFPRKLPERHPEVLVLGSKMFRESLSLMPKFAALRLILLSARESFPPRTREFRGQTMNFASRRKFHMRLELRTADSMVRACGPGGPRARISIRLPRSTARGPVGEAIILRRALRRRYSDAHPLLQKLHCSGARYHVTTTLHLGSFHMSEGQLSTIAGWGHSSFVTQGTVG